MKVLYDYQAFEFQNFGGVSKCFCELISNLPPDVQATIAIKQSNNVHLRDSKLVSNLEQITINEKSFRKKLPLHRTHKLYQLLTSLGIIKGAEYYNHRLAKRLLKEQNFDVFHPTFFDSYFLKYIGNKPWVITIHDMMPELFPQYFDRDNYQTQFKLKYLNKASAIVAVSETTKKDIVRLLGISPSKITVVYHGGPRKEEIKEEALVKSPYFLYVGMRGAYKNFDQTVIDFATFHKKHPETLLICTGKDFDAREMQLIKHNNVENSVLHIKASDVQLKNLYANAIAFIYPSLYEGFGMPILEAYAYGCPVLLNDIPVFREVADKAAIFFKSNDKNSDLVFHMEEVYSLTKEERKSLIEKGYSQLSKFSWKDSAYKLAKLYKALAKISENSHGGGITLREPSHSTNSQVKNDLDDVG